MPDVVVDNAFVKMVFYPDTKIIHHAFHQTTGGETLHAALDKGVEVLRQRGGCKWLSDDRNIGMVSQEDSDWSMFDWGPRAVAAGWKYWALVVPEEFAAKVSMSGIVEAYYDMGVRVMVFTDVDEAMEWLAPL